MTTEEKCEAILNQIITLTGNGREVIFEQDWGGNSLTIAVVGKGHTHVGGPDGTFEQLVDSLYANFVNGNGLSWV